MVRNLELEAELIAFGRPEKKQCYRNSLLALYALGEMEEGIEKAVYVEGFVFVMGLFWIEHGWLEVDGALVDVTLADTSPEDYRKVKEYTVKEVNAKWRRGEVKLPLFMNEKKLMKAMNEVGYELYG
jgi:hypothetical protein